MESVSQSANPKQGNIRVFFLFAEREDIRYLGRVRANVTNVQWRQYLLLEMTVRELRKKLNAVRPLHLYRQQ
jgi:hypothetical protein